MLRSTASGKPGEQRNPGPAKPCRCSLWRIPQRCSSTAGTLKSHTDCGEPSRRQSYPATVQRGEVASVAWGKIDKIRQPGLVSGRRRDREADDLVRSIRLGDEARLLGLLDEAARNSAPALLAWAVPTACCTAVNLPSRMRAPGIFVDVLEQARPQAREHVELVVHELSKAPSRPAIWHQLGILDVALEPEAVGGAAPRRRSARPSCRPRRSI